MLLGMNPQPLASGTQLFKDALRMYGERWKVLLAAVVLQLPFMLLGREDAGVITALGSLVIFMISQPILISAIASEDLAGDAIGAVFSRGLALFFPFFWIGILGGAAMTGATLLLVIPGIILSAYLSFSQFVLVSEHKRGMATLLGSWGYVHGRLGAVFLRGLFLILVAMLIGAVQGFVTAALAIGEALATTKPPMVMLVVSALLQVILAPVYPLYAYALYKNLRATVGALPTAEEDSYRKKIIMAMAVFGVVGGILLMLFAGVALVSALGAYGGQAGSVPVR